MFTDKFPFAKKTLQILSIDYSFFQNVNYETFKTLYPTPYTDQEAYIDKVWMSRYKDPKTKELLEEVHVNEEELFYIRHLLSSIIPEKLFVFENQANINTVLIPELQTIRSPKINIYHISMYSGIESLTKEEKANITNWITEIKRYVQSLRLTWAYNQISPALTSTDKLKNTDIHGSIKELLKNREFDTVFLCKNPNITPPHLDKEFNKLATFIKKTFSYTQIKPETLVPRI